MYLFTFTPTQPVQSQLEAAASAATASAIHQRQPSRRGSQQRRPNGLQSPPTLRHQSFAAKQQPQPIGNHRWRRCRRCHDPDASAQRQHASTATATGGDDKKTSAPAAAAARHFHDDGGNTFAVVTAAPQHDRDVVQRTRDAQAVRATARPRRAAAPAHHRQAAPESSTDEHALGVLQQPTAVEGRGAQRSGEPRRRRQRWWCSR